MVKVYSTKIIVNYHVVHHYEFILTIMDVFFVFITINDLTVIYFETNSDS